MFNMELSLGDFGGHAVVALHGELDLADVPAVESHLVAAVATCGPSVIVDLADLAFIDCCGLGALVRMLRWTWASGGDVSLAALPHHVRRIPSLTGLIGVFPVYPSVADAASAPAGQGADRGAVSAHAAAAARSGEHRVLVPAPRAG
jgi:anti-sigma B factor antagonist